MIYCKIKADSVKASEIKDFFHAEEINDGNHPYDYFSIKKDGVDIHAYKNRKDIFTIVFSSKDDDAIHRANLFSNDVTITESKEQESSKEKGPYFKCWEDLSYQIGSDEVGVGDFFGPLVVVASYITPKDVPILEQYKINDSKKRTDDYILSIGRSLRRKRKYYSVMVSADKLSFLTKNGFNIHKTRAKCHNLCHKGVREKYSLPSSLIVYVDQFAPEKDYRRLVGEDRIENPVYFRTKGESYYPSVALSSVLARYFFLKEWEKREKRFKTKIPKGASARVDRVYGTLLNQYGQEALNPFVKRYFRNYTSKIKN